VLGIIGNDIAVIEVFSLVVTKVAEIDAQVVFVNCGEFVTEHTRRAQAHTIGLVTQSY
jgi:hypothetical protein